MGWFRRTYTDEERYGLSRWQMQDLSDYNAQKGKVVFHPEYIEQMARLQSIYNEHIQRVGVLR